MHGLGTDSSAWDRVVAGARGRLPRGHRRPARLLACARSSTACPMRANSPTGSMRCWPTWGSARAVLVGHSFGGAVSLITAHGHPQRCAGLVLVAPGGFGAELNPFIPLIGTRFGSRLLRSLYGPRTSRTIERIASRVDGRSGQDSRVRIAELMETYDRLRSEEARAQFRTSVQAQPRAQRQSRAPAVRPDRSRDPDPDPVGPRRPGAAGLAGQERGDHAALGGGAHDRRRRAHAASQPRRGRPRARSARSPIRAGCAGGSARQEAEPHLALARCRCWCRPGTPTARCPAASVRP